MSRGVIVGCDQKQEWLLPWWWSHYKPHHPDLPIAFIDFGMSSQAKKWCRLHGALISLRAPHGFVFPKALISSELSEQWEERYGSHVWSGRTQWFYKPFALLQTPFKETIWLDLDCEVLGSLTPLFHKLSRCSQIALAQDNRGSFEEVGYNSGVILYHANSPLLADWASFCQRKNDLFLGDQEALTYLIQTERVDITQLPGKYNWIVKKGINPEAVVLHWSGSWGKETIRNRI